MNQLNLKLINKKSYLEEDFLISNSNENAFKSIIEKSIKINNIYLFGPNKSGKSHLASIWLKKNNGVSIVNISAFGAENPSLKFPTSSVVRSSLTSYAKLFSRRYGHHKIRMNNLLPGYVDSYPVTDEIRDKIALKREATVKEIANVVSFLLSNESSYITGQNLMIDGSMVVPE